MNANKSVRFAYRTIFTLTLTTIAAAATSSFAQESTAPADGLQRLIFGRKVFEPIHYYGTHRVYPQNGKITLQYAKCEPLNCEIMVPNQAWKRADPETEAAHRALMLIRHNPEITISLAGERVGIEAKVTTRAALSASQEKMKSQLGATILPGQQMVSGGKIQGIMYCASAEQDGRKVHYAMWVASRNGYTYSLAVFGDQKYGQVINKEMYNFLRDLHQLDANRVAHMERPLSVAEYRAVDRESSPSEEPMPFSKSLFR